MKKFYEKERQGMRNRRYDSDLEFVRTKVPDEKDFLEMNEEPRKL